MDKEIAHDNTADGLHCAACFPEQKAVVLCGNISDGYTVVGPFLSWDEAAVWAEYMSIESWVMTLEPSFMATERLRNV